MCLSHILPMLLLAVSRCPQVSRPHPSDHPLLFLFLVGGVTPSELRLIRDTVSAHRPGAQVREVGVWEAFVSAFCLFVCLLVCLFVCLFVCSHSVLITYLHM